MIEWLLVIFIICAFINNFKIYEGFSTFEYSFEINKALEKLSTNRDLKGIDFRKDNFSTNQHNKLVFENFLWDFNTVIPYNFILINIEESNVESYEGIKKYDLKTFVYDANENFGSNMFVTLVQENNKPTELIKGKIDVIKISTSTELKSPPKFYPYTSVEELSRLNNRNENDIFSREEKNIITEREKEEEIKKLNESNKPESSNYLCFGSKNTRAESEGSCINSGGFWDRPVEQNYQCPYFEANKNYPNSRGGMKESGFCDMPLGVQTLGYRGELETSQPLCYNCLIEKNVNGTVEIVRGIGECCKDQKNNSSLYPNMVSPDYAFPGDTIQRKANKESFISRGIEWARSIYG